MPEHPKFTGVDLAGPKRAGTAIITFALIGKERWIIDVRIKQLSSVETAGEIADVDRLYHPRLIAVEDNGYQTALLDWMRAARPGLPVIPFRTGLQKLDPCVGLPSLDIELEQGLWVVPYEKQHDPDCQCGTCKFVAQVRSYPLGTETDAVMAWWFAREAYVQFGGAQGSQPRTGGGAEAARIYREAW
ncbi:MAG: hypothetical protein PHW53_05175 [Patescibacteria group bacterium]|nr:hypothetical protein [Patescibacteria group bacterium]